MKPKKEAGKIISGRNEAGGARGGGAQGSHRASGRVGACGGSQNPGTVLRPLNHKDSSSTSSHGDHANSGQMRQNEPVRPGPETNRDPGGLLGASLAPRAPGLGPQPRPAGAPSTPGAAATLVSRGRAGAPVRHLVLFFCRLGCGFLIAVEVDLGHSHRPRAVSVSSRPGQALACHFSSRPLLGLEFARSAD